MKPVHREKVRLRGHVVSCGCGTEWFAAVEALNADGGVRSRSADPTTQTCPDCGARPAPGRIGALTEHVYDVPITLTTIARTAPSAASR